MASSENLPAISDDDLSGQFDKALTALHKVESMKGSNITITTPARNGDPKITVLYKKAPLIAAIKQIAFDRYYDLRNRGLTENADYILWTHEDEKAQPPTDAVLDSWWVVDRTFRLFNAMSAHRDVKESIGNAFTIGPSSIIKGQQSIPVGVVLDRNSFLKGIEIIANGIYHDLAGIDEERRNVANRVVTETNKIHQEQISPSLSR